MRLADQFSVPPETNDNALLALSRSIAGAQCFEFSESARDGCFQVASSKPSSILSAVPVTRLPYANTWIEWMGWPGEPEDRRNRYACLLEASSDKLSAGRMTRDFKQIIFKLEAFIDYAAKAKEWAALDQAIDEKIEEIDQFVGWWKHNVRDAGRPVNIVASPQQLTVSAAEKQTGVKKWQVSRWAKAAPFVRGSGPEVPRLHYAVSA
jgi:hypothetical protein